MNSCIILAMIIVSYVYPKIFLIETKDDTKSDYNISVGNGTKCAPKDSAYALLLKRQGKSDAEIAEIDTDEARKERFKNVAGNDGIVSYEEFMDNIKQQTAGSGEDRTIHTWAPKLFILMDMDGDGTQTYEEVVATRCRAFIFVVKLIQGKVNPQAQPPYPNQTHHDPKLVSQEGEDYCCCCCCCFPGTGMVMLDRGGKRSMEDLRIGDKIITVKNGNMEPTRVLGFLDKKVNKMAYYINLILEDNKSLFISSRHVMFIKGDNNIIQSILAKDVSLGDILIVDDGKKIGFVPVQNITVGLKMGAYVPLTYAGTLLVDGVLVSSYTNTYHWLAHIALSPLHWWPTLLLDNEISQNVEGLRTFPRLMRNLGSILGLVTMADKKVETIENPVLGMSQLAMEKMDKSEF